MLGIDKKSQNILLQYRVCKIYALTGASTSLVSELTGMPLSSVKRAIKILDTEFDNCNELLPDAQLIALNNGLISELEVINEDELRKLKHKALAARREKYKYAKWEDIEIYLDEYLSTYIAETRGLQNLNDERLKTPAAKADEFKSKLDSGYTYAELADEYNVSKSTVAYNANKGNPKK